MDTLFSYLQKQFPQIENPGDVLWSHAVNSPEKLEKSINKPDFMVIESDIRISKDGKIIAAHPPVIESDLEYKTLIEKMKNTNKVLKLDFKDPEIFKEALQILSQAQLTQAVLINADVLTGNGAPRTKWVPEAFMAVSEQLYPQGILSIGWTTNITDPYTKENIDDMLKLLEGYSKEVTFPTRACLLEKSWPELTRLLEANPSFTLGVWNNEPVDAHTAEWIKNNTDPNRTFYDFIDDNRDPMKLW